MKKIKLADRIELRDEIDKHYPETITRREWIKGGIPITDEYSAEVKNGRKILMELIRKSLSQ